MVEREDRTGLKSRKRKRWLEKTYKKCENQPYLFGLAMCLDKLSNAWPFVG